MYSAQYNEYVCTNCTCTYNNEYSDIEVVAILFLFFAGRIYINEYGMHLPKDNCPYCL